MIWRLIFRHALILCTLKKCLGTRRQFTKAVSNIIFKLFMYLLNSLNNRMILWTFVHKLLFKFNNLNHCLPWHYELLTKLFLPYKVILLTYKRYQNFFLVQGIYIKKKIIIHLNFWYRPIKMWCIYDTMSIFSVLSKP